MESKFQELSVNELQKIDGGKSYLQYLKEGALGGLTAGATAGATGSVATFGISIIGGAVLGANVGAIGGSLAYIADEIID